MRRKFGSHDDGALMTRSDHSPPINEDLIDFLHLHIWILDGDAVRWACLQSELSSQTRMPDLLPHTRRAQHRLMHGDVMRRVPRQFFLAPHDLC